ncbi:MAG: histidine kinase [Pseudomonadota bacterium]|nr:histidine kinase [Pseudomonadota bacterium]
MWRYAVGSVATLLLVAAGLVLFNSRQHSNAALPLQALTGAPVAQADSPLPDAAPEAADRTREQKRFDRYDKDRNGSVTREEYLMQRHKAFAKLDVNHDGMLSFDEWAIKAETKFAVADHDKSGALTAAEFATTAVKRKPHVRKPCAETPAPPAREEDS